jgi:hypothetical protein
LAPSLRCAGDPTSLLFNYPIIDWFRTMDPTHPSALTLLDTIHRAMPSPDPAEKDGGFFRDPNRYSGHVCELMTVYARRGGWAAVDWLWTASGRQSWYRTTSDVGKRTHWVDWIFRQIIVELDERHLPGLARWLLRELLPDQRLWFVPTSGLLMEAADRYFDADVLRRLVALQPRVLRSVFPYLYFLELCGDDDGGDAGAHVDRSLLAWLWGQARDVFSSPAAADVHLPKVAAHPCDEYDEWGTICDHGHVFAMACKFGDVALLDDVYHLRGWGIPNGRHGAFLAAYQEAVHYYALARTLVQRRQSWLGTPRHEGVWRWMFANIPVHALIAVLNTKDARILDADTMGLDHAAMCAFLQLPPVSTPPFELRAME